MPTFMMDKRYIVTISSAEEGRIHIVSIDQKQFKTVLNYKTMAQYKTEAMDTIKEMYDNDVVFLDKTGDRLPGTNFGY